MKLFLSILLVLIALRCESQTVFTTEVDGTVNMSSYGTSQTGFTLDYFVSYFHTTYPQYTNHIYDWSRSGTDWNGDYQSQEEKWCLPYWASFSVAGYDWVMANDNGSLDSNATYTAGILIAAGPPLFYNGTAQTNESIATIGITHLPLGRFPHDSSDGDSGAIAGNAGSMGLAAHLGVPVIDLWNRLWTNGWSSDVVGARILGFSAGSHPLAPGGLAGAIHMLLGLNVETNIGTLTFDWGAAAAYTNHVTASGISVSGDTLTATVHFDRMPMAWDAPDGTVTNNANTAFATMPSIGNAFNWIIQVTNLPPGNYRVLVDGQLVDSCTDAQLTSGRNWFPNTTGPLWAQRAAVLSAVRQQKGEDPVTLAYHSAGNTGTIGGVGDNVNFQSFASQYYDTDGFRGTNYTQNSNMLSIVSQVRQYDTAIHNAAVQTNHTFSITYAAPRFAPYHR